MMLCIAHTVSFLSLPQTWLLSCDVPVNAHFPFNKTAMLREVWLLCQDILTSQFPYAPCDVELISSNSGHQPWQHMSFVCCVIRWCMFWESMKSYLCADHLYKKEYSWYCTVLHTLTIVLQTIILHYKVRLHLWTKSVEQQVLAINISVQNALIKLCLQCKVHNFTMA